MNRESSAELCHGEQEESDRSPHAGEERLCLKPRKRFSWTFFITIVLGIILLFGEWVAIEHSRTLGRTREALFWLSIGLIIGVVLVIELVGIIQKQYPWFSNMLERWLTRELP